MLTCTRVFIQTVYGRVYGYVMYMDTYMNYG